MNDMITQEHVGSRLLVTKRYSNISRDEIRVLELSPSGEHVKVKNLGPKTEYWADTKDLRILEVLEDAKEWIGSAGDELNAMLKMRNL